MRRGGGGVKAKQDFVEAPTDDKLPIVRSAPKPDGGLGRQWAKAEKLPKQRTGGERLFYKRHGP
jgi:hypothetical protein